MKTIAKTWIVAVLWFPALVAVAEEESGNTAAPPKPQAAKADVDGLIRYLPWDGGGWDMPPSTNRQYLALLRHTEKRLELWDLSLDKPMRTYHYDGHISSAIVNAQGTFFLTCGLSSNQNEEDVTHLWDAAQDKPIRTIKGHRFFVTSAFLSDDGTRWLNVVGGNEIYTSLTLWDLSLAHARPISSISLGDGAHVGAIHFVGKTARCIAAQSGDVYFLDISRKKPLHRYGEYSYVNGKLLDYNDDLTKLLSWHPDKTGRSTLQIRTHAQQEPIRTFPALVSPYPGRLRIEVGAVFNSDATKFLTWDNLETVQCWSIDGEKPLATFQTDRYVSGAAFCRDENRLLTWGTKTVQLWDTKQKKAVRRFQHDDSVLGLTVHPNGKSFVSWQKNGAIQLWNFDSPEPVRTFHWLGVTQASFDRTGNRLITTTGYLEDVDESKVKEGMQIWDIAL